MDVVVAVLLAGFFFFRNHSFVQNRMEGGVKDGRGQIPSRNNFTFKWKSRRKRARPANDLKERTLCNNGPLATFRAWPAKWRFTLGRLWNPSLACQSVSWICKNLVPLQCVFYDPAVLGNCCRSHTRPPFWQRIRRTRKFSRAARTRAASSLAKRNVGRHKISTSSLEAHVLWQRRTCMAAARLHPAERSNLMSTSNSALVISQSQDRVVLFVKKTTLLMTLREC